MIEKSKENSIADQLYANGARSVHAVFTASVIGKEALDFLESLFLSGGFDPNKPSERALFHQGQASVIAEIKAMIRNVDNNFYEQN